MKSDEVYASCKFSFYYSKNILLSANCWLSLVFVNTFNVVKKRKDGRIKTLLPFQKSFISFSVIHKMLDAGYVDDKSRV